VVLGRDRNLAVIEGDRPARCADDHFAQHGVSYGRLGHWHVTGNKRLRDQKARSNDADRSPMDAEHSHRR
jgi:hypothetical protein